MEKTLINNTHNQAIKEYYFFDQNFYDKKLSTNENINLLNQKINKIKNNYKDIKEQKIFLIESNAHPKLKTKEEK